jgi:hypothetical protein
MPAGTAMGGGQDLAGERRQSRRRSMPYVRSAVLDLAGRSHIVAVTNLSPEGAFLRTQLRPAPGTPAQLRMVLPRESRELALPCEIVRRGDGPEPGTRVRGLAIRFGSLEASTRDGIREFSALGRSLGRPHRGPDRWEFRMLERATLDLEELNRLGLDGWNLAAVLSRADGLRLVLHRRL